MDQVNEMKQNKSTKFQNITDHVFCATCSVCDTYINFNFVPTIKMFFFGFCLFIISTSNRP